MRLAIRAAIAIAVIVALATSYCVYRGVSRSLHAEHVLHAALQTVQLLEDYVVASDGKWPTSWTDLERLPGRGQGMFQWPDESHEVQQYVTVDFSANPEQVAELGVEAFDAVQPIGPYYEFKYYSQVSSLLEAIRKHPQTAVDK